MLAVDTPLAMLIPLLEELGEMVSVFPSALRVKALAEVSVRDRLLIVMFAPKVMADAELVAKVTAAADPGIKACVKPPDVVDQLLVALPSEAAQTVGAVV